MPTRYTVGKLKLAMEAEPGDEIVGAFTRTQLLKMDADFCAAVERAISLGLERRPEGERRAVRAADEGARLARVRIANTRWGLVG
jgi:hypothetical protein